MTTTVCHYKKQGMKTTLDFLVESFECVPMVYVVDVTQV